MILKNHWEEKLKQTKIQICTQLKENISCDVLVIGGGVAGLHAAQRLLESGLKVVLIEKTICGGSSSGKSSGFLTPESEFGPSEIIKKYGSNAKEIWQIALKGTSLILNNIKKYNLNCDLQQQDGLYLGIGKSGKDKIKNQAIACKQLGYGYKTYNSYELKDIHPTKAYCAGISYPKTYCIVSLLYIQELKQVLISKGVDIYENTEALKIESNIVKTTLGSIKAKSIIVCIDKMKKDFSKAAKNTYHAQTFLAISEPLNKEEIKDIFPKKPFMCWDSNLIYSYYRLTKEGRLLLGGSSALTTYYPKPIRNPIIINKVIKNFKKKFPHLNKLKFINYWPGLIDITQDIMPIVDYDKENKCIQYVQGCPGLPWAAFCGDYAAQRTAKKRYKDYNKYFGSNRKFLIPFPVQTVISKPITYAISNLYAEYK